MLRERSAVVARARPVAIGNLRNNVAAFAQRFQDDPDIELHAQRALDPDLDVVEVYENRNLESCICQVLLLFPVPLRESQRGRIGPLSIMNDSTGIRGPGSVRLRGLAASARQPSPVAFGEGWAGGAREPQPEAGSYF